MTLWGHLGEMGKVRGNPSLPMGPGRPRAEIPQRLWKALRDNMSQGGSASFLIPPYSESRMKTQKQPHHYNPSRPSLTVQALRGSFKCFSVEKGRVEEDLSKLLLNRQNWSYAKTNNKQKRPLWYLCNNKKGKQHRRKAMKKQKTNTLETMISENHENTDNIVQLPKKWNKEPKTTTWWEKKAGRAKERNRQKIKL